MTNNNNSPNGVVPPVPINDQMTAASQHNHIPSTERSAGPPSIPSTERSAGPPPIPTGPPQRIGSGAAPPSMGVPPPSTIPQPEGHYHPHQNTSANRQPPPSRSSTHDRSNYQAPPSPSVNNTTTRGPLSSSSKYKRQ